MSVKIQQLVELIETLTLLKSTSEEAAIVFEKVIQSKANAHEGGLAGYLKEITADAKIASKVINELENEIKVVSSLSVKSSADESPVSGGVRSTPVVSDAARRRKEVQDKLDEERRARVQEIRGENRPAVVKRHTDRSINFELLLAQLDQQIDEREDTLRDMVRRTQAKMRTSVRSSQSSSPVADPEYADMKWALTTPDTRSATSYAVTPNRGGRVSVAQSGGARPPENASVSAIVKYVNTQLRHENPAETRPEIAPIVAELQKLVKDREEATVPADKNRINQQIKQAFKKINQSSGTVSNTQRQTAQESIIAPIIEALRAVKLDDPILNAAMSPVASSSEIESALTRAVEMLVTRLENGAAGRVGETALSTEGFEFLRPAAFDQLLKRLKTVVAEATTRPVIPRSRTVDPGTAEEVDSSALFLGTDFSIQNAGEDGSPQVVDALRSSRVFPGQVTRIGANISKYIQSLKASLNPTRRYSSEAQGVDVRAGSQVVAGSSSAVFGGGMDAEVQKAVDALFSTVMQDIEEGNIRPASIAGQTVDLPESLAKMVVEAIQSSSILSEHTTAFGRMAGTRGPRGAIVTGDPVRKFVALFAGDLINQYTSTGAVSDQSASRFVEQTVAPEQEQEVTLAVTHAKRLRERLVYQRDQADLSMVTAAPAMANRYRTESAKLGKEIQLLDEILAESENPEEEKKLAQRRGQIALPGSNTAPALTRDQALTVLFKQSIGSIPATPDAVAPIMSKAQEVSAGLAQSGLTIPARPSYGTSPVQSLVEYMTSGQSMALDRYQTTPITQQLDSAGTVSSGQQNREFIEIISDAFGLSRQSASAGNVITGMYHAARATDASGKMLEGEELDQSLGGGYRTKKGLQSIVQASAEMGSYGSGGIPLIEYAKLATSTDLDAEEQSLFQEVQAKLPHLQAIDSESLKQLAELDTSMDPKELIKRVLTLAAPAIKNQIVASIRRRGGAAGMGVDEVTQMISDYETAGVAPAGFQDEFRALAMFDPANINTTDVSAAVNRSLSLFSNLLTDNVQSGEGMPQFAARVLGRQDRLVGTGPDVAAAVPDQGASYSLLGKGAEVANQESGQVVGGAYGRNVENEIKIQEAMREFEQLTAEIEEMRSRIALAPHEADKILPVIDQKNNQLKILKQKLATYKASEPDPISQKFEYLSTIAQMDNIDPATRSGAIYDLGIMQEIFNQTGRYQIDESQGYGTGTQEQRLTNLMAHKAKLDNLQKLREERAALEAELPGDGPAKAVEAVIKESDVDGEIAAVKKDISDMRSEGAGSEKAIDVLSYADTIDEEIAIDENAVPLKIPRINLTERKNITEDVTAEDESVFVHSTTGEDQLIESPAFVAFLASKEEQEAKGNQDRLAIRQNAETGTLTAAVADGVSKAWFSTHLAEMLVQEAANLPADEPFTTESILARVNNRSAQTEVNDLLQLFAADDKDSTARLMLNRAGLQKTDESRNQFIEFLKPFEEAGTSPTVGELIKYLHSRQDKKDSGQIAGATFAAYRRTRSSEGYKHEFVTAGDALIESADLGISKETLGEDKGGYTGPSTAAIGATESGIMHEGRVLAVESKTPARVFLASDAYSHSGQFSKLDPEVDTEGFVGLGERLLLDEGELGTLQDDRSFIGITGSEQIGPVVKTGGLVKESFSETQSTEHLEASLAQEKRKLSQIKQAMTDEPDIDERLEKERQEDIERAKDKFERKKSLLNLIELTHKDIVDEYDAALQARLKRNSLSYEEAEENKATLQRLQQTPEMQKVFKARDEAHRAQKEYEAAEQTRPISARKAKVVTEANIQAIEGELVKRGILTTASETATPETPVSVISTPETIDEEIARVQGEIAALESPATKLAREAAERGVTGQGQVAGRTYVHPDVSHGELTYMSRRSTLPLTADYPEQISERFAKTGRIDISPEVPGSDASRVVNAAVAETLGLSVGPEVMPEVSAITPDNVPDTSASNRASAGAVPYFFVPGQSEPMVVVGQSTKSYKGRGVAIPVMGTVDPGQTQWQAAEREAQEELGVVFDPKADVPVAISPTTTDAFYMRRVQSVSPAATHFETQGVQILPLSAAIGQIDASRMSTQRDVAAGREALVALQAMVASGEITNDQEETPISNEQTQKMIELTAELTELEAKKKAAITGEDAQTIVDQEIAAGEEKVAALEQEIQRTEKLKTLQEVTIRSKKRQIEKQSVTGPVTIQEYQRPNFAYSYEAPGSRAEQESVFDELVEELFDSVPSEEYIAQLDSEIEKLDSLLKPEEEKRQAEIESFEPLKKRANRGIKEGTQESGMPPLLDAFARLGLDMENGEISTDSPFVGLDFGNIIGAAISMAPEDEKDRDSWNPEDLTAILNNAAENPEAAQALIERANLLASDPASKEKSEESKKRDRLKLKRAMLEDFAIEDESNPPEMHQPSWDIQRARRVNQGIRAKNEDVAARLQKIEEIDKLAEEDKAILQDLGVTVSPTDSSESVTTSVLNAASTEIARMILEDRAPSADRPVLSVDELRVGRNEELHKLPEEILDVGLAGNKNTLRETIGFESARRTQGMTGPAITVPTLAGLLANKDQLLLDKDGQPILIYRGEDEDQVAAKQGETPLAYEAVEREGDPLAVFPSEFPMAMGGGSRYGEGLYHTSTRTGSETDEEQSPDTSREVAHGYRSKSVEGEIRSSVNVSALLSTASLLDADSEMIQKAQQRVDERRIALGLTPLPKDTASAMRGGVEDVMEELYREKVDPTARLQSDILNEADMLMLPYGGGSSNINLGVKSYPVSRRTDVPEEVQTRLQALHEEFVAAPKPDELAVAMGYDAIRYRAEHNPNTPVHLNLFNAAATALVLDPVIPNTAKHLGSESLSLQVEPTLREEAKYSETERRAQELQSQLEQQKQQLEALKARSEALKQEAAAASTPSVDVTAVTEESKRVADETVKVSADIKVPTEEIQKRKADVDAKIAEAEQAVAQSQQVIELMQRQAQGLDTEDSDIRFVVDNTGIPVSYEDKQVIDRTSLRPLVRTKMTVDDTGESGFVSNLNVRDIVDQAEAVKPTAELMDEISKMSDADLAAVKMPRATLSPEDQAIDDELKRKSREAQNYASRLYNTEGPISAAIKEYYRTPSGDRKDELLKTHPELKTIVDEIQKQENLVIQHDASRAALTAPAVAAAESSASPLQLAARLFRSSRAAVRAYETEFGVEPAFSAREVMDELLASSARAEVDSAPAGSAETAVALDKTISSFEGGIPEIKGSTDRAPRRPRRAPADVVADVEQPYTENQLKYARAQVRALAGRTDLTAEQKRQLSEARKKLHNYAMKRLTTNFGDNKGVMQIANVVAGLTPPDWAKDDVQSARVSAISQAMASLKPIQLAKLKDADLTNPVQMDILSRDPALQPIMAMLADQDIESVLKFRSGTTEYDEAKGLLGAIKGARERIVVPEPDEPTTSTAAEAKRLFFDLETNIAKKPEDRLIFQAATGVNDGAVTDMYAVPLDSSAEEINRIAADPTIPDDEKRKLIRALALKREGKLPLVEGRASGNDVSSGVIDKLVDTAMSGRQIMSQGQIRKNLQLQIEGATTVAGHNIQKFDLPTVYGGTMAVPDAVKAKTEDTLLMSRDMYPGSHTLGATYEAVTGDPLVDAHDAAVDTRAVQRIFPQVSDPEERAKVTEAYLAKHGIAVDSTVGQLVATPKLEDIADAEERKKATSRVAAAHSFYRPLADMQEFTRRIARRGDKTILRDADRTVAAEQDWYDMSASEKSSLFDRMNSMFAGDLKGKKIEELNPEELGEFVKKINTEYLEPNADAAVGGDFGGMKRLLEEKVGGGMSFRDFRAKDARVADIKGKTIEDVVATADLSPVTVGPAISKETVGDAIEDISLATERPTKVKTPGSAPSVTASTSDGGSKEPPREPPVTFSDDADSGERGGPGGGITTIASATIDTLHAGAVEINIHGGNVTIDANFSAGAAEKMQKSLVYISNKDGMNVNGDVTSVGTGGGGGGYRRVSVADRSILNQLDAAKNQIAGQLQTETDPATRERLRGNLNEVSRQAIRAIIEPKVKAIDSEGMEPYVNERFYYGDETTDSKESLTYYNDAVAQAHQDLTTQLEAQQAIPEGTDGRDEEIQRIQKQISLVEELINALTELNQAEQRVGSATSTRAIVDPTEVKKPAYPTNNSGYRKLSPEDRASLAVLDATKNSISEQLRTEQDPEARARLKETLTGASKKAIADIIKPKATKLLGYGFVNTVDALSTSPEDSLVNYSQAAQSKLSELNGRLFMIESEREDAPGREEAIERTKREIQQVHELIDALTELNQAEQRVGAAGATRNAESPYGPKPTADPRAGANKYRKVSFADQASFNVLESTKNEVSARLRDETDSAARDALRQSLVNASERAINEVIKPKAAKVLNPTQLAALSALPMGPEEALVSYNEMAQYNLNNLSTELATQEALPEGTSGRDTEIERLKAEIAAVEELINALTELNAIEQRVGSASGTRNVNSPYGTTSGTGTGTSASKYYSRKAKEDEQVFLQLARNSFDQSAGSMGIAGGTTADSRKFLTDLTRSTATTMINSSGIQAPGMAADIAAIAATSPEVQSAYDDAAKSLTDFSGKVGGTITDVADDLFTVVSGLEKLKAALTPIAATSPQAAAALAVVQTAIDETSAAGKEQRGTAGVIETDNRKKVSLVEEQMQAAASRPGFFAGGRREREMRQIQEGYIRDTFGKEGLDALMHRGRIRAYTATGKRVDMAQATVQEQRDTVERLQKQGINITAEDMTGIARMSGRVEQTKRSAPMGDKLFYAASKIRDTQSVVQAAVDTVTSLANIPQMAGGMIQQFASSATGSNRVMTTARGLALDPENYTAALNAADMQRKQFGGSLTSNLGQVTSFIPLSNAYGVDIGKSVKVARKLAAFDPAQGMEGAGIAIKEFLSGNVSSLSRRFEINRSALSKINTGDATQMLDSLDQLLSSMGVTDRLIDEQANSMATKYDKMIGNLESVQISSTTAIVDFITPALESLIGEQSYFGKNVKERSLNTVLKETITSYGDDVLSDPETGLDSVNIGGSLSTFTSQMDTILATANGRMAGQAGRYNSATGASVSVPGYRLLGNMKPQERANIQFEALLGQAQGMNATQAIMRAMRNNPGDYNSSPEFLNQRESLKTRQVNADPAAYAEAYKKAEAGLLVADQGATDLSVLGLGYINFNDEPVKDKPLMTKGRIRKQVDADTYDIEIPGREDLVRVRTGVIDAQEKGTQDEFAARVGGADIVGMDRAMIGGEYKSGEGPEITLVGTLKNIDENNRVVAQLLNSEGKNYSLEMIATGNASSAFMQGLDKQTIDSLGYIEKVVADNGVGPQNRVARDLNLGGTPEISEEVRSSYFWNKYGLGLGGSAVAGSAAGLGGAALATNATLGTAGLAGLGGLMAAEIAAAVALPAVAAVGLYAGGAYVSDRLDSSPEKMRELYRMQSELNQQNAKMNVFTSFAAEANLEAEQIGQYVGGSKYRSDKPSKEIVLAPGFGAGATVLPGTGTPKKSTALIMEESIASLGPVYLANYEEAAKSGQERFATAGDATKRILERQVYDPISKSMMSYVDYEAQTIAFKKTADVDPTTYRKFDSMREEILKPIGQTGALIENEKLVERGIKYGTRLDKRALAEAKASPLRADIVDLTKKRDDAFEAGALAEGQKYQTQINKAAAKIEEITYTDVEWNKVPEAMRYLIMSAEEVNNMTAEEIRLAADQTYQQGLNPTDYKQEAKNFFDGTMDRNFQRRQQRVDTTLTAFARQSIMGLGEQTTANLTGVNANGSSGSAGLVMDNTPEARAVRMAQRSGLMPRNRAGAEDTVQMVTEAQRAAVREQQDIGRTNRAIALANAPEAQLLKSGFTNFAMYMNLAGSTAQDLGRSFMDTMNIMSEGNPRYGLDLAQQMTGFSYDSMIGMQLRPRGNDENGNPISSLNGLNGQPYSGSGPMVMPYTSGPRGTIAYSRDMMAVNAQGVRENALGIAPSQWQQFVSNATNANAELQRRGMSNAIQERDLNKNHQRNLEDIARNGMRQLESIHLNYTRTMQQMTMQADLVKGVTRANATRSIAMAAIDPADKAAVESQYWAQDMYSQHLGQGDSKNFLAKDTATMDALVAIDPSLSANFDALRTADAAYEASSITDPNRQALQDAKRSEIEPILEKLRNMRSTVTDPTQLAAIDSAIVRLSPDASKTIAGQNANQTWLQQTLGDKITAKQLGQQISDQQFQNQFRPLDIANDAASLADAAKSKDPLAFLNASRSSQTMSRGFAQSDIGLAETMNSLSGLLGTGSLFEANTTESFKQIADVAGSATQGVLYSLDDFETSFQQQMEDALRNFNNQRLDMIQAFADAAVEIASIVPEEMVPIMAATSAFMNTQRQADLLWLSGRTDEANALAYQGMLKLGEVVYGEGQGKEYADKYSANYQDMADVAARDVPQGDLGKFGVNTEDGWALRVKPTYALEKKPPVVPTPPPPGGWTQPGPPTTSS
jgi:hypothetical protein